MYLEHKFEVHDSTYKFPLQAHQVNALKNSNANLYRLYNTYKKCEKNIDVVSNQWLDAAITTKRLKQGHNYTLPHADDIINNDYLQQTIPLIKHQPIKGLYLAMGHKHSYTF